MDQIHGRYLREVGRSLLAENSLCKKPWMLFPFFLLVLVVVVIAANTASFAPRFSHEAHLFTGKVDM